MTGSVLAVRKTLLDYARSYIARGWYVLPCWAMNTEGVCSCPKGAACRSPGKHPSIPQGVNGASISEHQIKLWFANNEQQNIAIKTGKASGLYVVDLDVSKGKQGLLRWEELDTADADTLTAVTGSGGRHLVFAYPDNVPEHNLRTRSNFPAQDIDIRSDGGYIVVEPSNHASGKEAFYCWDDFKEPVNNIPKWLLERISADLRDNNNEQGITPGEAEKSLLDELRMALAYIPADDYHLWIKIGLACHGACNGNDDGLWIWDLWSQSSKKKYDTATCIEKWVSFGKKPRQEGFDAVGKKTIFLEAQARGWVNKEAQSMVVETAIKPSVKYKAIDDSFQRNTCPVDAIEALADWLDGQCPTIYPLASHQAALAIASYSIARAYRFGHDWTPATGVFTLIGPNQQAFDPLAKAVETVIRNSDHNAMALNEIPTLVELNQALMASPAVFIQTKHLVTLYHSYKRYGFGTKPFDLFNTLMSYDGGGIFSLNGNRFATSRRDFNKRATFYDPCLTFLLRISASDQESLLNDEALSSYTPLTMLGLRYRANQGQSNTSIQSGALPPGEVIDIMQQLADKRTLTDVQVPPEPRACVIRSPIDPLTVYYSLLNLAESMQSGYAIVIAESAYERFKKIITVLGAWQGVALNTGPVISDEMISWAAGFVRQEMCSLIQLLNSSLQDTSSQYRMNARQQLIAYLGVQGAAGGTLTELRHRCSKFKALSGSEKKELIEDLIETKIVVRVGGVRPKGVAYVLTELATEV